MMKLRGILCKFVKLIDSASDSPDMAECDFAQDENASEMNKTLLNIWKQISFQVIDCRNVYKKLNSLLGI